MQRFRPSSPLTAPTNAPESLHKASFILSWMSVRGEPGVGPKIKSNWKAMPAALMSSTTPDMRESLMFTLKVALEECAHEAPAAPRLIGFERLQDDLLRLGHPQLELDEAAGKHELHE